MKEPFYQKMSSCKQALGITLLAAGFAAAAVFFNIRGVTVKTENTARSGFSFFDLIVSGIRGMTGRDAYGNRTGGFSFKTAAPVLLGLVAVSAMVLMVRVGLRDYRKAAGVMQGKVPEKQLPEKHPFLMRALPAALLILTAVFLHMTPAFRENVSALRSLRDSWSQMIQYSNRAGMYSRYHIGWGVIFFFACLICYLGGQMYYFVLDTLNEDGPSGPAE